MKDSNNAPSLVFRQVLKSSGVEEANIDVYDNGTIATTKFAKKAAGWGGGGNGGGNRTCSGSCDGVALGPINCPAGSSPHLNCTTNPPTLTCVNDGVVGLDRPVIYV